MNTLERYRTLGVAVTASLLCSLVLLLMADTALRKQFWMDEGFEISQVCVRPVGQMLREGSFGCSPAPLFSALERLVVRSVEPLGLSIRLTYRAISLAAATLTLLLVLLGLQRRLGLPAALVAFACLAADPAFHHYAEQNRSYLTWVLASAALVLGAAELSVRDEVRPHLRLAMLLALGLLAGSSALPGCIQAMAAYVAWMFVGRALRPSVPLGRRSVLVLLLGGLAIVALDVHYWSGSVCRGWQGAREIGLDILAGADRSTMIRHALSVLWLPATSVWVWLGYAGLVLGALAPALWWRRRASLTTSERYAFALSVFALAQILVALPVGVSLLASRYLFLPRMFLFLVVARAVLTGLGFWVAANALGASRSRTLGRAAPALAAAASALATVGALWHAEQISKPWRVPFPPVGEIDCAALKAPELKVLMPEDKPDEFILNFQVRLGSALDRCTGQTTAAAPPGVILALDATNQADWFQVRDVAPPGFKPLQVCGRPLTLRRGRAAYE